jgi:N-acetylglucosaminyldiphosphoundecaprenol N-acetyl-beta-D-mannosaminyltransferase
MTLFRLTQLDKFYHRNMVSVWTKSQMSLFNFSINNKSDVQVGGTTIREGVLFAPNTSHVVKLRQDKEFYQVHKVNYRICNSNILIFVYNMLGVPFRDKIFDFDLFMAFL